MKVKVIVELDIPDTKSDDDCPDWYMREMVTYAYTHYVTTRHLIDAMGWMDSDSPNKEYHIKHHRLWSKISEKSKVTIERM